MSIIQPQIDCSTAEQFLTALSPLGTHFQDAALKDSWLFRGQGQDRPLVPSLFRKDGKLATLTRLDVEDDIDGRMLTLRDLLIQFFEIADKRGLMLPDDSQSLRSLIETLKSEWGDTMIKKNRNASDALKNLLSLEALAQHYGIPTRLLDWTRLQFFAAFFAAEDAFNNLSSIEKSSHLIVWAFYFPAFGKHYELSRDNDPIRIVTAPSATNPNLKAQQGVFTLTNDFYDTDKEGEYIPLEQILESEGRKAESGTTSRDKIIADCKLQKFTLPVSETEQLLYLLNKVDVTPSVVYPGFQSILRELQMENLWF